LRPAIAIALPHIAMFAREAAGNPERNTGGSQGRRLRAAPLAFFQPNDDAENMRPNEEPLRPL